jgi:hypothetical protein
MQAVILSSSLNDLYINVNEFNMSSFLFTCRIFEWSNAKCFSISDKFVVSVDDCQDKRMTYSSP